MQTAQKHHLKKHKRLSLTEKLAVASTLFTFVSMIIAAISLLR